MTSSTATRGSMRRGLSRWPVSRIVLVVVWGVANMSALMPSTPSTITTTCTGSPDATPWLPSATWASSMAEVAKKRTGPTPSVRVGCWVCGSHFTQLQRSAFSGEATTISRTSVGACHAATWATIEYASRRADSTSPTSSNREKPRRLIWRGTLGTVKCVRMKRRRAPVVNGSRSSTGFDSGGTMRFANCCRPTEIRSAMKSSASGRRSHIRRSPAMAHNVSGAGWRQVTALRWSAAVLRTWRRVWPR